MRALDRGWLGCSNHGGRQLDGAISAIDTLAGIAGYCADNTTILLIAVFVRGADDVLKRWHWVLKQCSLAPLMYGLTHGRTGVK